MIIMLATLRSMVSSSLNFSLKKKVSQQELILVNYDGGGGKFFPGPNILESQKVAKNV